MSDKDASDGASVTAGLLAVGCIIILGAMWIIEQILEWIDDHSREIEMVLTMIGIGLAVSLGLFGLWKLIRRNLRNNEKRRVKELERSQREKAAQSSAAQLAEATQREATRQKQNRLQEHYIKWLQSSPVDNACADATKSLQGLEAQLQTLNDFLRELQSRDADAMLPTHRSQHEETLAAVRSAIKTIDSHVAMWRDRLIVLTAQRMLQCALRSVPPWLGGTPSEERPQGSEHLWPKKPINILETLMETGQALQKVNAALVSMRQTQTVMAQDWSRSAREAKIHLQTLVERAKRLHDQLSTRLVECQTHEDRQRAFSLIAQTPAGTLKAGELDAFFPKDIEPIETNLLISVPQIYDLEDELRELKRTVDGNIAAGRADHEIEALTQAPGGHVLPPRRPKITQ